MNTMSYAIGVVLMLFGGSSLVEVSVDNHIGFWTSAIAFSVGLAICVTEFIKKSEGR